ncbi:MAG: hypothetical protein GX825_05065 [Syntrophomonadaceae bacterium]|nr:hypothetical protein [Syntrophomonadaceae bacterium]
MLGSDIFLTLLILGLAVLIELAAIRMMLPMLVQGGAIRRNFCNDEIPVAGGLTFLVAVLATFIILHFFNLFDIGGVEFYLIAVMGMAFLGFIDDMLGQRDSLGFRGHFSLLFTKGRLTTGALKALGGGMIAIYVAMVYSADMGELVVNFLLVALFTNSMNLFDLRPGRCIKAFLLIFFPLLLFQGELFLAFLPLVGAVLAFFPGDLKAKVMMGDTGSNVLGVTLGVMAVWGLSLSVRIGLVILLVALHILTERYSLTKIIEANQGLSWFDSLGRSDNRSGQ